MRLRLLRKRGRRSEELRSGGVLGEERRREEQMEGKK